MAKYDVLITNNENLHIILKKTGYQIYPCYSNELDKNLLHKEVSKKIYLKWTEFWLAMTIIKQSCLYTDIDILPKHNYIE